MCHVYRMFMLILITECFFADGRIDQDALSKVLQKYSPERLPKLMCFICGPSKMIDAIEALLLKLNILEHQIKYEKWWQMLIQGQYLWKSWHSEKSNQNKQLLIHDTLLSVMLTTCHLTQSMGPDPKFHELVPSEVANPRYAF